MRVLVTGGAGFIGSHIVDQLIAAGHEPAAVDDLSSGDKANLADGVPLYEVDIRDADRLAAAFDEFRPEAVCHQAAQMSVSRSVREPVFDAAVNVTGLIRVFENAVRVGAKRITFASSGGVLYGEATSPAPEETPPGPISPYGITKLAGELYLKFFCHDHGLEGVALRYSNVYGPRQNPHGEAGVVAIFCKKLLAGQPPTINGDGKYVRDYVFGPDVARANVAALTADLPDVFVPLNIGTGRAADVNDLVHLLTPLVAQARENMGRPGAIPAPLHGPARAGDLRSNMVDPAKAARVLHWKPTTTLEAGLRETVEWFAARA